MRVGIAHHLGWAVAITATGSPDHAVVDRRRIELVEPGLPNAPVHHEGGPHAMHRSGPPLDDEALVALVSEVRASAVRATSAALDALASGVRESIASLSLRAWDDLPTDIAVLRQAPHESRADSVMYREVLGEAAADRGWDLHRFEARTVESDARRLLGTRAADVLEAPRTRLGPPWTKDHTIALAATVLASCPASAPLGGDAPLPPPLDGIDPL